MLLVITVTGVLAFAGTSSGYTVYKQSNVIEMQQPPTIDRTFNVFYNLYKMFQSWASGSASNVSSTPAYPNRRGYTMDERPITNQEFVAWSEGETTTTMMAMMEEKKMPKPEFWLFDKFLKRTDLVQMTKVFLKLIVLKKIVKFVALVGLLFFIPTLTDETIFNKVEAKGGDPRNVNVWGKLKRLE
jgi:hypothetical protein